MSMLLIFQGRGIHMKFKIFLVLLHFLLEEEMDSNIHPLVLNFFINPFEEMRFPCREVLFYQDMTKFEPML